MRILLLCLALCLLKFPAEAERRAFVVGVQNYDELTDLSKTISDAEGYAEVFGDELGFAVTKLIDPTFSDFLIALSDFEASIQEGDEVVFVFSGHGWSDGARNFLAMRDAPLQSTEVVLERLTFDLNDYVIDNFRARDPEVIIAIVDACRDNPFDLGTKSVTKGLVPQQTIPGTLVAYAAGANQKALDRLEPGDPSPYSVFTRALLPKLKDPQKPLMLAFDEARSETSELANTISHLQRPAIYSDVALDFCFSDNCESSSVFAIDLEHRFEPGWEFRDCEDCPTMVVLPAGEYYIGSPEDEEGRGENEGPQKLIKIGQEFAVGKFEITWNEWESCIADAVCTDHKRAGMGGPVDEGMGRGNRPVINVGWDDAQSYVTWLSQKTGQRYRLLTEAEWEFAARAGTSGPYFFDPKNEQFCNYANSADETDPIMGDYCLSVDEYTAVVGSRAPNQFGLHDMIGNVWEWTEDCYYPSYDGLSDDGSSRSGDEETCDYRTMRGGSWGETAKELRVASRTGNGFNARFGFLGFRVARELN